MSKFSRAEIFRCYRYIYLIRRFEERLAELFSAGKLGGTSHFCIGQEASAVGVISECADSDYLVSNHRGHGHLLARGLSSDRIMGELMGRTSGYCGGRGGSQHMCSMDNYFLGTNGITGGGIPIATGAAFALKYKASKQIVVVFFGDGASNQGTFHESLNMASLWGLPILFVCENNGYAMSQPVTESCASNSIVQRAEAYNIASKSCDGMDLLAVKSMAADLISQVREGDEPRFLELKTYRHCGHSKNDARLYRTRDEEKEWLERDCVVLTANILRALGVTDKELGKVHADVELELDNAIKDAQLAPSVDRADMVIGGVYA